LIEKPFGCAGQRAQALFAERCIRDIIGAPAETPEKLVADYLEGTFTLGENLCAH
jgi:hypothetical protein